MAVNETISKRLIVFALKVALIYLRNHAKIIQTAPIIQEGSDLLAYFDGK
jgi:hypothetical protein